MGLVKSKARTVITNSWRRQHAARWPRQTALLICLGLSFVSFSRCSSTAQLSVDEILRKVSETYQDLQNYQFLADLSTETAAVGEDRSVDGSRTMSNFHKTTTSQIELDATNSRKVHLHVKDDSSEVLVVGDGSTIWTFLPKKKQYTEVSTNTPLDPDRPEIKLLAYYQNLLVMRFRLLQRHSPNFVLEKDKQIKAGASKVDCYVLKMETSQGTYAVWVDKTRFVVWRSEDSGPTPQEGISFKRTATVTLREANLDAKLDDKLFKF